MPANTLADPIDVRRIAWQLRADLRRGAAAGDPLPRWFQLWWMTEGEREYPAWAGRLEAAKRDLLMPLPDWPSYGRFGMNEILRSLIERREDLQQAFDVTTEPGMWHAIAWFFTHGMKEHGLAASLDEATLAALDETPPILPVFQEAGHTHPQLTWLMFFVWRCDAYLQSTFDLCSAPGQVAYLKWFFLHGVPGLGLERLVAPRWLAWLRRPLTLPALAPLSVPRAALLMWQQRRDLRLAFDLRRRQGLIDLAHWTQEARAVDPALWWVEAPSASSTADSGDLTRAAAPRPFGVNLIGFAFGELGIGEDVRMAVAACEAADLPFAVVNIHPGDTVRQADKALAGRVARQATFEDAAPYAINVFCLTGFDTARIYLERGLPLFDGRYNIGWWPWELPVWPKGWQLAFELVDEVWAATEFTFAMYSQAQQTLPEPAMCPVPVTLMPLPASVGRVKSITRRKLGLPAKRFLFLYVFDFNSYLARKNPFAAIRAFRRAFPTDDASVGLVLKTMNSRRKSSVWSRFLRECAKDERIVLLDRTLDRSAVLGLIDACDAYVSLHRSEGFGRTLAEAMLFGKPVVGTDFSGNVDFLSAEHGFPVRWSRKPVNPGEYPFVTAADSAWWAEPSSAHAARQLKAAREAAKDHEFCNKVRQYASQQFSPKRIGTMMSIRLRAIMAQQTGHDKGAWT